MLLQSTKNKALSLREKKIRHEKSLKYYKNNIEKLLEKNYTRIDLFKKIAEKFNWETWTAVRDLIYKKLREEIDQEQKLAEVEEQINKLKKEQEKIRIKILNK